MGFLGQQDAFPVPEELIYNIRTGHQIPIPAISMLPGSCHDGIHTGTMGIRDRGGAGRGYLAPCRESGKCL